MAWSSIKIIVTFVREKSVRNGLLIIYNYRWNDVLSMRRNFPFLLSFENSFAKTCVSIRQFQLLCLKSINWIHYWVKPLKLIKLQLTYRLTLCFAWKKKFVSKAISSYSVRWRYSVTFQHNWSNTKGLYFEKVISRQNF